MRNMLFAALLISFTSCGISVSNIPLDGKAVKKTVTVCTEKAKQQVKAVAVKKTVQDKKTTGVTKASLAREMLLMLW